MSTIVLGDWRGDVLPLALEAFADGETRGGRAVAPPPAAIQVEVPRTTFDCVALDALKDHPAIDLIASGEIERGAAFRLLRFPFGISSCGHAAIEEAHYTVRFLAGRESGPEAISHSIYPLREREERGITTEIGIDPKLKVGPIGDLGSARLGRTVQAHQSRSVLVGLWSEQGGEWIVRAVSGEQHGVEGTWDFFIVARWPRGVQPLTVEIAVSASVRAPRSPLRWRTRVAQHRIDAVTPRGCLPIVG